MKKFFKLELEDKTYFLRLTVGGQKELRRRFNENALQTAMSASDDLERMTALLDAALSWPGNPNGEVTGDELYEKLVDAGYAGESDFCALALDIAACSGVVKEDRAEQMKVTITRAVDRVYDSIMSGMEDEAGLVAVDPDETARPTMAAS